MLRDLNQRRLPGAGKLLASAYGTDCAAIPKIRAAMLRNGSRLIVGGMNGQAASEVLPASGSLLFHRRRFGIATADDTGAGSSNFQIIDFSFWFSLWNRLTLMHAYWIQLVHVLAEGLVSCRVASLASVRRFVCGERRVDASGCEARPVTGRSNR
jgi:hypothetical protein